MLDVTAMGEILIDFAARESDSQGYPILQANPGGAPVNFLAALSAYGTKTAFIGKVGADAFGDLLMHTLKKAGINTRGVLQDENVFTTLAFVTFDKNGERIFSFARKPGADSVLHPNEIDLSILDETRAFHFGTVSMTKEPARTTTIQAVTYAKALGKLLTFDPNLRFTLWDSRIDAKNAAIWGFQQADIVKISDEETEFLWEGRSKEEVAGILLNKYGVKLVLITMGANGCYLQNRLAGAEVKSIRTKPIDTTGAGDIFGGSALSLMLSKEKAPEELTQEELIEIAGFSSVAAGLSTERFGGISSIPSESEVLQRLSMEKELLIKAVNLG